MASDRIGGKAAELVAVPPYEIIFTTTDRLLTEPTVAQNIHNVPANEPLIASIKENGIKNPFLCMKSWYPIAGSQRLRAVQILKDEDDSFDLVISINTLHCLHAYELEKALREIERVGKSNKY